MLGEGGGGSPRLLKDPPVNPYTKSNSNKGSYKRTIPDKRRKPSVDIYSTIEIMFLMDMKTVYISLTELKTQFPNMC